MPGGNLGFCKNAKASTKPREKLKESWQPPEKENKRSIPASVRTIDLKESLKNPVIIAIQVSKKLPSNTSIKDENYVQSPNSIQLNICPSSLAFIW